MARARNIKPGFFRNAELVELPTETRLLFIGLWTIADREGRLQDRPKQIKMEIYPADSFDIEAMLLQLHEAGLILRYEVDGNRYIQVVNFTKHQYPHRDEKPSTIPAPYKHHVGTMLDVGRDESNPADILNPESYNLNPDPQTKTSSADAPSLPDEPEGFEEAWAHYPQRPGRSKVDALRAWKARVKEGVDPAALIDGVRRYAAYCRGTNTEPQFVKQPATFFGPGQHYLSDWTIPAARASPRQSQAAEREQVSMILTGRGRGNEQRSGGNERDITGEVVRVA